MLSCFLSTGTFAPPCHDKVLQGSWNFLRSTCITACLRCRQWGSYELAPKVYAWVCSAEAEEDVLVKTLPAMFVPFRATRATPRDWLFFLKDVLTLRTGQNNQFGPLCGTDARTTTLLCLHESDISHAESFVWLFRRRGHGRWKSGSHSFWASGKAHRAMFRIPCGRCSRGSWSH